MVFGETDYTSYHVVHFLITKDHLSLKIALLHEKIANIRADLTHKTTFRLIQENQLICMESLRVKNMVKNPKLAKHILDANLAYFGAFRPPISSVSEQVHIVLLLYYAEYVVSQYLRSN